jgi:hypothetical protein
VLKILGRGAIALTVGLLELAGWILWAFLSVLGFVLFLKRFAERATLAIIRAGKRRRARRASRADAAAMRVPIASEPDPAHAVVSFR